MGAVRFEKTAKDDMEDSSWDGSKAVSRLRKWASSNGSGDKDTINWTKYRRGFAWFDTDDEESFGAYKLPHHDVVDGTLTVIWRGAIAAMSALLGGRGGTTIPESERRATHRHLASHYDQYDEEPPEFHRASQPNDAPKDRAIILSDFPLTVEMAEGGDGKPRSTVQLMKGGDFSHPWYENGLHFDRSLFDELVSNFDANVVNREIAADLDHFSASPSYGWIEALEARGRGTRQASLWATLRWTPLGEDVIENELYKYTSVEMAFDFEDEFGETHGNTVVGMALTNRPFLRGMREVTLNAQRFPDYWEEEPTAARRSREKMMSLFHDLIAKLSGTITEETGEKPTEDEVVDRLAEILQASESVEEDAEPDEDRTLFRTQLSDALDELVRDATPTMVLGDNAPKESPESLELTEPDPEESITMDETQPDEAAELKELVTASSAKIAELETKNTVLEGAVAELTDQRDNFAAEQRLDAARLAGKITPAMEEAWARDLARTDPEGFERIVASLEARTDLTPETGSDATNDDEAIIDDPVAAFDARVKEISVEEDIPYDKAYRKVKTSETALYLAYASAQNLGVARR